MWIFSIISCFFLYTNANHILQTSCSSECGSPVPPVQLVCGSDGRVYHSDCHLRTEAECRRRNSSLPALRRVRGSECEQKLIKPCFRALAGFLNKANGENLLSYLPHCTNDGLYEAVQCHKPHRDQQVDCFCVWPDGKTCAGTSVSERAPDCSKRCKVKSDSCDFLKFSQFITALGQAFKEEYVHLTGSRGNHDYLHNKTVQWKFSDLDKNGDSKLGKSELKALRRMAKKSIEHGVCAKKMVKHCDGNKDEAIDIKEWLRCFFPPQVLGILKPEVKPTTKGPFRRDISFPMPSIVSNRKKNEEPTRIKNCIETVREQQLSNSHSGLLRYQCEDDGTFKPKQCTDSIPPICVCVDPITGVSPDTPEQNPAGCNTTRYTDHTKSKRTFKNCPMSRKFIKLIRKKIRMEFTTNSQLGSSKSSTRHSLQMKFKSLDTDSSSGISKREWRRSSIISEQELKRRKFTKCSRNFFMFCDANRDKTVTLAEWIKCTKTDAARIILPLSKIPFRVSDLQPEDILNGLK